MRYLPQSMIVGALGRGKSVEQFMGKVVQPGVEGIRYIEIRPASDWFEVWLYELADDGGEDFTDLVEFSPLFGSDAETPFATFPDLEAALQFSYLQFGASRDRWVNELVSHSEYLDYVRAGRPSRWPQQS